MFSRGYGDYDIEKALENIHREKTKEIVINKRIYSDTARRIKILLFGLLGLFLLTALLIILNSGLENLSEKKSF